MALSPRLDVRQSQSLTLTPQLMQSIKLLQLSHVELAAFVDAELLRNPLLERAEPEGEAGAAGEAGDAEAAAELPTAEAIAGRFDTEVENLFPDEPAQAAPAARLREPGRAGDGGEAPDLDTYVASRPTLAEHLSAQIGLLLANPSDRLIAGLLLDGLDEAGYLTVELDAVAARVGARLADVERVLAAVQGCEPCGVFARSLAECLALQLRERDRLDPMMARLLANLDLLARHDLAPLARATGADREDLADMLAELRRLDPRPGRAFESGPVEAVIPDVFVSAAHGGGWAVELNAEVLPRVLVDRRYHAEIAGRTREPGARAFLSDCLASASWLTKSLDQRAQTILKVTTEIVRQQDGFLRHGVARLRPMTLKLVADAIGMHESTVSRVTTGKYVATPRGTFEMKYFFTTALGSATGEADHSAEAVRHRIRQLIEAEPPAAILSDDAIAEILLKEQGIEVARRTVAKYREGMNIPSSVIRRRQKRALALAR